MNQVFAKNIHMLVQVEGVRSKLTVQLCRFDGVRVRSKINAHLFIAWRLSTLKTWLSRQSEPKTSTSSSCIATDNVPGIHIETGGKVNCMIIRRSIGLYSGCVDC